MEVTINLDVLKATLLCILIIVIIALAIYAIYAVFNLVKTLKKTQKVLDDFEVVSAIASERSKQLDKLIEDMTKKIKSGQNIFNSLPVIFSTITKVAKAVSQKTAAKPNPGKTNSSK